jgi:hypothetical protein
LPPLLDDPPSSVSSGVCSAGTRPVSACQCVASPESPCGLIEVKFKEHPLLDKTQLVTIAAFASNISRVQEVSSVGPKHPAVRRPTYPVSVDQDDAPAHRRLASYCAHNPVSLDRMAYDADAGTVNCSSDKSSGSTAGCHTFDALDFVALALAQIPDKGQVLQRCYGYYSSRGRGMRRKQLQKRGRPWNPPTSQSTRPMPPRAPPLAADGPSCFAASSRSIR